MSNLAIVIVDLDKLSKEEWHDMWDKAGEYAQKISNSQKKVLVHTIEGLCNGIEELERG